MQGPLVPNKGYKAGAGWSERLNHLEDLRAQEPQHKVIHVADATTSKTTISVGAWFGRKTDAAGTETGPGLGANASFVTDTAVEERKIRSNGKVVTTFSANSSVGGQVMLMLIGKPSSKAQPFATGGGAGEENESASISVLWNADGTVEHVQLRTSTTTLKRWSAEAGGHVSVPLGPFEIFNAGGYKTSGGAEGSEEVVELTIPMSGLSPEARQMLQSNADALFPRDENGNLDKGATRDFGKDPADGYLGDILEEISATGGTRTLEYDVTEQRDGSKAGLKVAAIKLWSSSWTDIDTEKVLTGSNLQYVDVDGTSRTVSPAPKCRAPMTDTSGPDYYDATGSDPITSSHPDGQGYYLDRSKTPVRRT